MEGGIGQACCSRLSGAGSVASSPVPDRRPESSTSSRAPWSTQPASGGVDEHRLQLHEGERRVVPRPAMARANR